jgi:hypothetical protein
MRAAYRCVLLLPVVAWSGALAQEPVYMEAATHPGRGKVTLRLLTVRAVEERGGGEERRTTRGVFKGAWGISGRLAALVDAEWDRVRGTAEADGLAKVSLRVKQRIHKRDLGPVDTWRTSLQLGAEIPGDESVHGPRRVGGRWGLVSTAIWGRHGWNGEIDWTARSSERDEMEVNASYVFRLAPARYGATTRDAWYAVAESLNQWFEGGSNRHDLALGVLYEATQWAAEVSLRLPVKQEAGIERDVSWAAGVRYLL